MSHRWPEWRLGDVCSIASDFVDPRDPACRDLPHVGGANLQSGTDALIGVKSAAEEKLISGKFAFDQGVVLYSKIRPYLRKVARPDFPGLCSADVYPLTPRTGLIIRDYLYYVLISEGFTAYAEQGSARSGMPKVNREHLFDFRLRLPPLTEQRRIVSILDEAIKGVSAAVRNASRSVANARSLFQETLAAKMALGDWPLVPFEECLEKVHYTNKVQRKEFKPTGRYPIISQEAAFINGFWDDANDLFRVSHPVVIFGDHTRVLKFVDFDFVLGADGVKILKPNSKFNAKFFYYAVRAIDLSAIGYARHYRVLKETSVPCPPLNDQSQTVVLLGELEANALELEAIYKRKLGLLEELKQSLLARAFSGALTREPLAA